MRAALLAAVVLGARFAVADGLPDLVPSISQINIQRDTDVPAADVAEGCAGDVVHRTLVRFTLGTLNAGTADVVLGDPGCPECVGDPPPMCTNPLFMCSEAQGHHHPHFQKYAFYSLLPRPDSPPAATGRKQGFCIEDTLCDVRKYNCNFQGLQVGCRDAYFYVLGCQYVDATGLPNARYILRADVNYAHIIPESNFDNNTAEAPVDLCDDATDARLRIGRLDGRVAPWTAHGVVHFATPGVTSDPAADGAVVVVRLDDMSVVDVAIPGGGPGTGCGPRDGWRTTREGWFYRNLSGFLDPGCQRPTGGLSRLRLTRLADGFGYAVHGRLTHAATAPPAKVDTTVVLGSVTGPCGTARIAGCAARQGLARDVVCPASPSGAFLDAFAW